MRGYAGWLSWPVAMTSASAVYVRGPLRRVGALTVHVAAASSHRQAVTVRS